MGSNAGMEKRRSCRMYEGESTENRKYLHMYICKYLRFSVDSPSYIISTLVQISKLEAICPPQNNHFDLTVRTVI
jgi:hypothetical protein